MILEELMQIDEKISGLIIEFHDVFTFTNNTKFY